MRVFFFHLIVFMNCLLWALFTFVLSSLILIVGTLYIHHGFKFDEFVEVVLIFLFNFNLIAVVPSRRLYVQRKNQ